MELSWLLQRYTEIFFIYHTPLQGAAKALIFPVVQQFTEAFVQALQMPDGPSSDSGLKMEVLKVRDQRLMVPLNKCRV